MSGLSGSRVKCPAMHDIPNGEFQMKHTLILVGADKGGVGKTTISRALLDFMNRKNILVRAFDTENPRGTLNRFYPGITEIIDLGSVASQMKVLDTLKTSEVKVTIVDLKALIHSKRSAFWRLPVTANSIWVWCMSWGRQSLLWMK